MEATDFSNDPAAKQALDALTRQKWRQARDHAKELCKKDRPRFLPLLIEANTGLAREMLSRRLLPEAKTVIEYLAGIAPAEIVEPLKQELLLASISPGLQEKSTYSHPKVDVDAARLQLFESKWTGLLKLAQRFQSNTALTGEDYCMIDETVCFFDTPARLADDPLARKVADELAAVHRAATEAADGNREAFRACLREIPATSIFRHWRIFLKGFEHSVHGEPVEARASFERLPKSQFLSSLIDGIEGGIPRSFVPQRKLAHWFFAVCGSDPQYAPDLVQLEAAWRSGKWKEALFLLKKVFGKDFGRNKPGVEFAISDSVFTPPEKQGADTDDLWENAFSFLESQITRHHGVFDNEYEILRTTALSCWHFISPDNLNYAVERIIEIRQKQEQSNPLRNAVWLAWLGKKMAAEAPYDPLNNLARMLFKSKAPRERMVDSRRAAKALESAINLDPSDVESAILLHGIYLETGQKKTANQLLERLCVQHPENKQLLMLQGRECRIRSSFLKAAENFRKALVLDPLDKGARQNLLTSLLEHVFKSRRKPEASLNPELWNEIFSLADRDPFSPYALWALRLRMALLACDVDLVQEIEKEAPNLIIYFCALEVIAHSWKTDLPVPVQLLDEFDWMDILPALRFACGARECAELGRDPDGTLMAGFYQIFQDLDLSLKIAEDPDAFLVFVDSLRPMLLQELEEESTSRICHDFVIYLKAATSASSELPRSALQAIQYAQFFFQTYNFHYVVNPQSLRRGINKQIRQLKSEEAPAFEPRYNALLEYLKKYPNGGERIPTPRKPAKKKKAQKKAKPPGPKTPVKPVPPPQVPPAADQLDLPL